MREHKLNHKTESYLILWFSSTFATNHDSGITPALGMVTLCKSRFNSSSPPTASFRCLGLILFLFPNPFFSSLPAGSKTCIKKIRVAQINKDQLYVLIIKDKRKKKD